MSKIIKSHWTQTIYDEQKVISIKMLNSMKKDDSILELNRYAEQQKELLNQAHAEADAIVKEAELQAQSIREQIAREKAAWGREKTALVERARQEGMERGLEEGRKLGYQEYRQSILFAQEVVNTAKRDYHQQVASAEKTILQLGISAAEKILGEKLDNNEEGFMVVVKRALKEARESREVQIHVNPCHYEFLLERKSELTIIFPKETNIYIYPNDELSETSCLIESASGRIDAGIDSQLAEMKRKLLEMLESESYEY